MTCGSMISNDEACTNLIFAMKPAHGARIHFIARSTQMRILCTSLQMTQTHHLFTIHTYLNHTGIVLPHILIA